MCGTGSGELEFGTTRRACSRSHLAVLSSRFQPRGPRRQTGHTALGPENLDLGEPVLIAPVAT